MKAISNSVFLAMLIASSLDLGACGGGTGGTGGGGTTPAAPTYAIGGTVVNLVGMGGGLILKNSNGETLPVSANGNFTFLTTVTGGSSYNVTVSAQPSSPAQTCGVTNGSGTAESNVTNITVDCSHNEWTWMQGSNTLNQIGAYGTLNTANATNTPGARQVPATWTDASGNLWLFGGYGYDSAGTLAPLSDLWKYSGGQWTWMGGSNLALQKGIYGTQGVPSASNIPGARFQALSWTDPSGDVWLFGGNGCDANGNEVPLNDLWKYSRGQWTWMAGANVGQHVGTYGIQGVAASGNVPGSRDSAVGWTDSSGDLWLFGGLVLDSVGATGELNDLWKYSGGQWTWVGGSKMARQAGTYGTQGTPAPSDFPGARFGSTGWKDANGNFWLFGGVGFSVGSVDGILNDLWKYSAGEWTWMGGSNTLNQAGVYGTQGIPAMNNAPGARQYAVGWVDSSGNFWLFGGSGQDSNGTAGELNDLWKYSSGQWTWMTGAKLVNQNAAYGTLSVAAPGSTPSARDFLGQWNDGKGNLWLFGGYGLGAGTAGNLNDLWRYLP